MPIDDERKAAETVQAILRTLTPTTPRTDALVHSLRIAASAATNAGNQNLSSELALNNARGNPATALNGAAGLLDRGALSQTMIARARGAVRRGCSRCKEGEPDLRLYRTQNSICQF